MFYNFISGCDLSQPSSFDNFKKAILKIPIPLKLF